MRKGVREPWKGGKGEEKIKWLFVERRAPRATFLRKERTKGLEIVREKGRQWCDHVEIRGAVLITFRGGEAALKGDKTEIHFERTFPCKVWEMKKTTENSPRHRRMMLKNQKGRITAGLGCYWLCFIDCLAHPACCPKSEWLMACFLPCSFGYRLYHSLSIFLFYFFYSEKHTDALM